MTTADLVKTKLTSAFPNGQVEVRDPMQDDTHLEATIVSDDFTGKSRLQRHRLVNEAIADAFGSNELHALQITTRSPDEV